MAQQAPHACVTPGSCMTPETCMQESWYEKLNRWDEALDAYEKKYSHAKDAATRTEAVLGRAR